MYFIIKINKAAHHTTGQLTIYNDTTQTHNNNKQKTPHLDSSFLDSKTLESPESHSYDKENTKFADEYCKPFRVKIVWF